MPPRIGKRRSFGRRRQFLPDSDDPGQLGAGDGFVGMEQAVLVAFDDPERAQAGDGQCAAGTSAKPLPATGAAAACQANRSSWIGSDGSRTFVSGNTSRVARPA